MDGILALLTTVSPGAIRVPAPLSAAPDFARLLAIETMPASGARQMLADPGKPVPTTGNGCEVAVSSGLPGDLLVAVAADAATTAPHVLSTAASTVAQPAPSPAAAPSDRTEEPPPMPRIRKAPESLIAQPPVSRLLSPTPGVQVTPPVPAAATEPAPSPLVGRAPVLPPAPVPPASSLAGDDAGTRSAPTGIDAREVRPMAEQMPATPVALPAPADRAVATPSVEHPVEPDAVAVVAPLRSLEVAPSAQYAVTADQPAKKDQSAPAELALEDMREPQPEPASPPAGERSATLIDRDHAAPPVLTVDQGEDPLVDHPIVSGSIPILQTEIAPPRSASVSSPVLAEPVANSRAAAHAPLATQATAPVMLDVRAQMAIPPLEARGAAQAVLPVEPRAGYAMPTAKTVRSAEIGVTPAPVQRLAMQDTVVAPSAAPTGSTVWSTIPASPVAAEPQPTSPTAIDLPAAPNDPRISAPSSIRLHDIMPVPADRAPTVPPSPTALPASSPAQVAELPVDAVAARLREEVRAAYTVPAPVPADTPARFALAPRPAIEQPVLPTEIRTPAPVIAQATAPVAPGLADRKIDSAPAGGSQAVAPPTSAPVPIAAAVAVPRIVPASEAFAGALFQATETVRQSPRAPREVPASVAAIASAPSLTHVNPAAPAREAMPVDTGRSEWIEAMIDHIELVSAASDAGRRETRIRLSPDHLGSVDIVIERDGDATNLRFAAETGATRALLTEAAPRLAEIAESRGLKLGQASVDAGGTGSDSDARSQPQDRPAPARPASAHAREAAAAADRTEPTTQHRIA